MSSAVASKGELLNVYRRLIRLAKIYPSRNRDGILASIREEFRENVNLDPDEEATKRKVSLAIKGISQLNQFNSTNMSGGRQSPNWQVSLDQNPMPVPENYVRPNKQQQDTPFVR